MADAGSLTFWYTLLAASVGSALTILGQTFIHWLQQRSYRENELWKRQLERFEELERLVSRALFDMTVTVDPNLSIPDDDVQKAKLRLIALHSEIGMFGAELGRYPGLTRATIGCIVILGEYWKFHMEHPEAVESDVLVQRLHRARSEFLELIDTLKRDHLTKRSKRKV